MINLINMISTCLFNPLYIRLDGWMEECRNTSRGKIDNRFCIFNDNNNWLVKISIS